MPKEERYSILNSVKLRCKLPLDYDVYDDELIGYINAQLNVLSQAGVGSLGFQIEDDKSKWSDFLGDDVNKNSPAVEYLKTRVQIDFDPPANSFVLTAKEKICDELLWRATSLATHSYE